MFFIVDFKTFFYISISTKALKALFYRINMYKRNRRKWKIKRSKVENKRNIEDINEEMNNDEEDTLNLEGGLALKDQSWKEIVKSFRLKIE